MCLLTEADIAPLAKLGVCHADLTALEVHVVEGERHQLPYAKSRVPERVQHNVVAQAEGIRRVERRENAPDLLLSEGLDWGLVRLGFAHSRKNILGRVPLLLQPGRERFEVADVVTDRRVRQRRLRCSLRCRVGFSATLRLQVGDVAFDESAVEVLQPALPD